MTLRKMVAQLSEAGYTGDASDLTTPVLLRFWLANKHQDESRSRLMLRGYDKFDRQARACGACVSGRPQYPRPAENEAVPALHRNGVATPDRLLHHGDRRRAGTTDPRWSGVDRANLAWLLLRRGPLTALSVIDHVGDQWARQPEQRVRNPRDHNSRSLKHVRQTLFPDHQTQLAYRLLFGIYTGIVFGCSVGRSAYGTGGSGSNRRILGGFEVPPRTTAGNRNRGSPCRDTPEADNASQNGP